MQEKIKQTALITGASSGIGWELAQLFAADGINVVLVARSHEKLKLLAQDLETVHSIQARVIALDLGIPSSPDEIFKILQHESIEIHYLINNAGFGIRGGFNTSNRKEILEMLQVNITALTHLTHLFLGPMLVKKSGKILNVASTAAFQPGPWMAVYYASKSYVLSFSEALHYELKGTGVSVTALSPGPTQTGFQERAGAKDIQLMKSKLMKVMDAKTVARKGYEGMMENQRVIVPGLVNRILATGAHIGPRSIAMAIAGSLNKKK